MDKHLKRTKFVSKVNWTTEQDSFLIENSQQSLEFLIQELRLDPEEIQERRKVLGLIRRDRQFRKTYQV
ncbi:MAG: hypothetical protein QM666_08280 [Acinetobacter sp.]